MRLAGVEVDDRHAALQAEIDLYDAGQRLERLAQHGEILGLEIRDRDDGCLGFSVSQSATNLTKPSDLCNAIN